MTFYRMYFIRVSRVLPGVRKAFELGVRIVLIDSPDSWSKKLVDEKKAVKFIGAAWLESGVVRSGPGDAQKTKVEVKCRR